MSDLPLGELLGALSLATDLAAGVPIETSVRTSVLATHAGRVLGLADTVVRDAHYVGLLRHLGCTAFAVEEAAIAGGDDHGLLRTFEGVDAARRGATARRALGLGRGQGAGRRVAAVARVIARPGAGPALARAQCAQAEALAGDLGLPAGVVTALAQLYERHDGRGPLGLRGAAIHPAASLLHLAEVIEIHHRTRGREVAHAEVARRRGRHLAPAVADAFLSAPAAWWRLLEGGSPWPEFVAGEPLPLRVPAARVEEVALAFARFADVKSPYRIGHSPAVAALAAAAAGPRLRLAGLLHDLGAVSVPNGIWDKPGALTAVEHERVRLHAYHTERILVRAPALAACAAIAAAHHERADGSGYHRGAAGGVLDDDARVLAAADVYQALREDRPHRPARAPAAAAAVLAAEAQAGRLCRRAVERVLGAAGHAAARVPAPAGLTPREVEILVLLARGRSNKQIAAALGIAVRTVNHHVEHVYGKTGVDNRAAAALFAVRHELVRPQ